MLERFSWELQVSGQAPNLEIAKEIEIIRISASQQLRGVVSES